MAKIISANRIRQNTIRDKHENIKNKIQDSYDYFSDNYKRFNDQRINIFKTSLNDEQRATLERLGKPIIEVNIQEAYISRLRGEFLKQEPSLSIRPRSGKTTSPELIKLLESHLRAMFFDANLDGLEYDVYTDVLSGGFSALKVYTDYSHEMSFEQNVFIRRCYDPTLVGFDKMAVLSHKGDGEFCFEFFPMSRCRFESEYGEEATSNMKFLRNDQGFSWSYTTENDEIVLVCHFYEKKRIKQKIVRTMDGRVMTVDDYEKMLEKWSNFIAPPAVIGKPRTTEIVQICRSTLVEGETLEYVETDLKYLPLIFVDGNSVLLRKGSMGAVEQLTRGYGYHGKGVQSLKNLASISLANELENLMQSKVMAAVEAIPEQYRDAYLDPQMPSVLLFHAYKNNDPNIPLPAPSVIPRQAAPPEITQTFQMCDSALQMVFGSFDASLGINNNQLSGIAIEEGATQSNATAMPYIAGFLKALNQVGVICLDLFTKYYVEPRSIPIKDFSGNKQYQEINGDSPFQMNYQPQELEVNIEAGVNFEIQKARSYARFIDLMKNFPIFEQFILEPNVMESILDNIDFIGIDYIKEAVPKFIEQQKMSQQMSQQMAQVNNPYAIKQKELQLKQAELQQKSQNDIASNQLEAARINVLQEQAATDRIDSLAKIGQVSDLNTLQADKIQAEKARTAVEAATNLADMKHRHAVDILNIHHKNEHKNRDFLKKLRDDMVKNNSQNIVQ